MKTMIISGIIFTLCFFTTISHASDDLTDVLTNILDKSLDGGGLSDAKIGEGLLEALKIGTGNAVGFVSKLDGYYKSPTIKIPLPKEMQQAQSLLELAGHGEKIEEFVESMNRAAEKAAPQAKEMFFGAIKQMTFKDARKILEGRDNEATLYFKDKMSDNLFKAFEPTIHEAMAKVGVTGKFQSLELLINALPISGVSDFKLDKYVTNLALDGLFKIVAEEERKIRKDPAAQVTDLLKDVFGK